MQSSPRSPSGPGDEASGHAVVLRERQRIQHGLAPDVTFDLVHGVRAATVTVVVRRPALVREEKAVGQPAQGAVGLQRLLLVNVQRGEEAAGLQLRGQCVLVHDRTARGVDDVPARLHRGQRLGVDGVERVRAVAGVDRDDVALPEKFLQVPDGLDAKLFLLLLVDVAREDEDPHVEGLEHAHQLAGDRAEAVQPHGLVEEALRDPAPVFLRGLAPFLQVVHLLLPETRAAQRSQDHHLFYKKVSEKPEMFEKLLKSKIKIDALTDEILCRKLILYSSSVHRMSVYRKLKSKNLKKFVKLNDHERIYKISISISVTLRLEGKFEEARQVLTYALTHSINNSHDSEAKLFNLLILELDYYENKISGVDFFRQCKNCYESYTLGKTKSYMLYTALWCLCKIANYIDSEQDVKKYSVELIKVCSIIGRKYEAADRSFWIKSDKMKSDIVKWKIDKEKDILIPYFDKIAHQNFADSFFSFQRHSYEINNINRLALIYLFNIEIEFWKLSGADFEKVYLMLNKLIRLVKKHNTSVKQVWINFNKTFFKFLDESRFVKSDTIYKRYSVQINSVLKGLMDKSMKYNIITEYAQIYIISEYYNCNELKTDAKILFNWIRKNRPEILLYAYNSVDKNDKPEKLSSL